MPPDGGPMNSQTYVSGSPFVRLLATPGRVKILDVLLRRPSSQFSAAEIAEAADIDEGTFSRNKQVLEALDIINVEKSGRKLLYQINTDNPVVKILVEAHIELLDYVEEIAEKTTVQEEDYIGKVLAVEHSSKSQEYDADAMKGLKDAMVSEAD